MKNLSKHIKKIHKESNTILKKNFIFYCFFKFYNSNYKNKISNFLLNFFLVLFLIIDFIVSSYIYSIIPEISNEHLKYIVFYIILILISLIGAGIFRNFMKILFFAKEKFVFFIIKKIENYIFNSFNGINKSILENINNIFVFIGRSSESIDNSLNKEDFKSDINFSNISPNLILKFEKQININSF